MVNKYELNDEQLTAVQSPSPLYLNASAGAGKTKTLIAKIYYLIDNGALPESILAVTFTNRAANEMRIRLGKVCDVKKMQISTIHSMCVQIIRKYINYTYLQWPFSIYDSDNQISIVKIILKARNLSENSYECLQYIGQKKSGFILTESKNYNFVYEEYQKILKKNNAVDFDDLQTLALECLNHEDCKFYFNNLWKHILVDEFQDTNLIQYKIIERLYSPSLTKTLFVVGDYNQCVIQGTNIFTPLGEIKVENIEKGKIILAGTGNTNVGKNLITGYFKKYVTNQPIVTIETISGKKLTTTEDHIHFAEFIEFNEKFYTYLMYKQGLGYRIGITQSARNNGKYGFKHSFKGRLNQEKADFIWLLKECSSRKEAQYYEQFFSVKYGIPTWIFLEVNTKYDHIKQEMLNRLFQNIDTITGAEKLLKDLHLNRFYPHHTTKYPNNTRRSFTIFLCGAERLHKNKNGINSNSNTTGHYFLISGSDKSDCTLLSKWGLNIRNSIKDRNGYTAEGDRKEFSEIQSIINKISLNFNVFLKAHFSEQSLSLIPATNIIPGMSTYIFDGEKVKIEKIIKVYRDNYSGYVYDLNIDKVHNFIANGILTHNSIYAFRNARPENINDFIKKFKAHVCHLTFNYRSSSEIINHANNYLQFGKPMVTKNDTKGKVSFAQFRNLEDEAELISQAIQKMGDYENTAIIYRVNSRSVFFEKALATKRIPYKVVGDIPFYRRKVSKDLLSYCKAAMNAQDMESLLRIVNVPRRGFGDAKQEKLMNEGWPYLHECAKSMPLIDHLIKTVEGIRNKKPLQAMEEVVFQTGYRDYLKTDSDRIMLTTFLNVAAGFNSLEELILTSTFLEEDSGKGVKLMTAHASKGLEFNKVFVVGVEGGVWPHALAEDVDEESRLYYVACTRAKSWLNISCSKSRLYKGSKIDVLPSPLF